MVTTSPRKSKVLNILGDWDDVRFFLAVAKTGSFSAAATQLNTKQTTVGRRIQALERRLGAKLFDRHRHGMEVTPAARGVLVQAESMLSNATSIERHLAGLDREMAGVVRVAATEGLAATWLVPRLGQLRITPSRHHRPGGRRRPGARPRHAPGRPCHPLLPADLQPARRRAGRPGQFLGLRRALLHRALRPAAVAGQAARTPDRRPHHAAQPAGDEAVERGRRARPGGGAAHQLVLRRHGGRTASATASPCSPTTSPRCRT